MRVYVVDDHPVVREGLLAALKAEAGFDVVGQAGTGDIALCELRAVPADVVVVDDGLDGGIDSVELVRRLGAAPYSLSCLVLTSNETTAGLREFLAAGATSLVSKSVDVPLLVQAVATTATGQRFFDPRALRVLVQDPAPDRPAAADFDDRERLILRCLADGRSNREIAAILHVSTGSVKKYVSCLLHKLEVSHRTSAIAAAAELGLLDSVRPLPAQTTPSDPPRAVAGFALT
jgi:DNA-binding NarL/FixJ family response regulator